MLKFKHDYSIPEEVYGNWRALLETTGAQRVLNRQRLNKGQAIYPGLASDSREMLAVCAETAETLNSIAPVTENEDGTVGSNAAAGDFNQLYTVAGYGMDPITTPPMSNLALRKKLGLKEGWQRPRHREIFRRLVKLMCAVKKPAKVSIRREASTGSPDYVNDVPKKKAELRYALENLDEYLELVEKDNLLELFIRFNSPIVQTTGERTQADKVTLEGKRRVSKPREVNGEAYARGLDEADRYDADKRVFVHGQELRGHFAGRRRTVYGMSFVPNYVVATVFSAMREHYLQEYEFTWKHRAPDSILAKMKRFKYLAGFDVKQFDQSVPTFMIDEFCSELPHYVDKRLAKLISLMFKAPYIVPYPWVAGSKAAKPFNPLFGNDPFDVSSFTMELGLPSGISCNPDFGKLVMMTQYLCLADDFYGDVLEVGVETILHGEHDKYAFLNMGDDCVVLINDERFYRHIVEGAYTASYFAVEPEKPISFLGNVPYRDDRGELKLAPNIVSFFVNWLVPEFGVDNHRRRDFWAVGDRERRQHYARAPLYHECYVAYEDIFRKHVGRTPSAIAAEYYDQQRKFGSMSYIDALVLQNPDYLQYRFSEADLSDPNILELLVTSLSAEEVWPLIAGFV